jgi:hypothetical protein
MYADDKNVTLAKDLGFTVMQDVQYGHKFKKGICVIWPIRDGYQCADLVNEYYVNHRSYVDLGVALRLEA